MNMTLETIKIYWSEVKKYPKLLIPTLILSPLGSITFRIIPPLIAADVIRRLGAGEFGDSAWSSFGSSLIWYAFFTMFGGIFVFRATVFFGWSLETRVVKNIYERMFGHLMSLDSSFHANNFAGSLVSRSNKLANSYIRIADTTLFQLIPMITGFIAVVVVMAPKSPVFTLSVVGFSTVFIATILLFGKNLKQRFTELANSDNRITGDIADMVTNVMAVKSFSAHKAEAKRFTKSTEHQRKTSLKALRSIIKRDFSASVITTGIQIAALVMAVFAVVEQNQDIAVVFLMVSYTSYLADQLWMFSTSTIKNYNIAFGNAHEATGTLLTNMEVTDPKHPEKLAVRQGAISIQNVVFDHEEKDSPNAALFNNFNLEIKPGEKIGLVGRSGSGKTTVTRLLLRFMDIDSGKISIDEQNITAITQSDLRSAISYVPQEPLLFHRSLSENIAYGRPDATTEQITQAAKNAHADEFIRTLTDGYETLVGERGVKLSGGQRQRVAIARAMIKDAPILVLDEATSALDSESEILIQDALWKLMEGKTAIVIAHRLSTIQKMDRIVVMDKGAIVEQGSHKELLAKNGVYAKLWAHQSGGFIEE
jgi:ATP-binding cassette subfamily B protein